MIMIEAIKKILQNKNHRNIAVFSILCISVVTVSIFFLFGQNNPIEENNNLDTVNMEEPQVPLGNIAKKISAGDIVTLNVFADEMNDVYGYQFNINFDRDFIDYKKRFYSDIGEILTIFATDKEWHLLVGATMNGDAKGYSGQKVAVCRVEFIALTDFELNPDFTSDHIALSDVNVVTSDLQYLENVDGWTVNMAVQ